MEPIALLKQRIEPAHAAEAAREGDLSDRQARVGQQPFGEEQTLRLRKRHGRYAELALEDASQMPVGDTKARRDCIGARIVDRAVLDQPRGGVREAPYRIDAGVARRQFRAAAQARPVAGCFGRGGAREVTAVFALGRAHGADGPAIDARRGNRHEEPAVEASVAGAQRAITGGGIEQHGRNYAPLGDRLLAVFGPRGEGMAWGGVAAADEAIRAGR